MKSNPRRTARQSNPYSLIRAQRDVKVTLAHDDQPETVNCLDIRTGQRLLVSDSAVYAATFNSFRALNGRPQSEVMRELLSAGVVLANSKGVFWSENYWTRRSRNSKRFDLQRAA